MQTFTVTNGWTRVPVQDAIVSANGKQARTDAYGQVQLHRTVLCVPVEVIASNFLERRTCAYADITLWPIADDDERQTTRIAAFDNDLLLLDLWHPTLVAFAPELVSTRPDVIETWRAAALEIGGATEARFAFEFVETPVAGESYIIRSADPTTACPGAQAWPIETGGFCLDHPPPFLTSRINVPHNRLTERSIAVRALLFVAGALNPHPGPGLLNAIRPDPELSTFERKILRMIGLRAANVVWPDYDQNW